TRLYPPLTQSTTRLPVRFRFVPPAVVAGVEGWISQCSRSSDGVLVHLWLVTFSGDLAARNSAVVMAENPRWVTRSLLFRSQTRQCDGPGAHGRTFDRGACRSIVGTSLPCCLGRVGNHVGNYAWLRNHRQVTGGYICDFRLRSLRHERKLRRRDCLVLRTDDSP